MDQDGTWHGGRPQPRRLCVRWGPSSFSKGAEPGSGEDRRDKLRIAVILPGSAEDGRSLSSCRGRRRAAVSMSRTCRSTKGRSTRRNSRWGTRPATQVRASSHSQFPIVHELQGVPVHLPPPLDSSSLVFSYTPGSVEQKKGC